MRLNVSQNPETKQQLVYRALVLLLVIGALTGGGSRSDIQSLILLRPLTIIFVGFGLWHLQMKHIRANRFLFIMAAVIFTLPLIQLIPLPSAFSGWLAEHRLISAINAATGIGTPMRPISLVPHATWNAWFSLFGPLAILLLAVQLPSEKAVLLVPVLISIGAAGALLGVFQLMGPANSALYLYRITNFGDSVGLFANRNHHAILLVCLLPMLAVYAATFEAGRLRRDKTNWRPLTAFVLGATILPLILLTSSRSGLIAIPIALGAAWFCFHRPPAGISLLNDPVHSKWMLGSITLVTVTLCAATLWASESSAITRLVESDGSSEFRFQMWQPIAQQTLHYLPFGSGLGSFVEAFQIAEPDAILTPTYVNHAHNDWLEIVMTTGIFGIILLAITIVSWVRAGRELATQCEERRAVLRTGQLGWWILMILAVAGITDYPVRTPFIAFLFVIATVWIANAIRKSTSGDLHIEK